MARTVVHAVGIAALLTSRFSLVVAITSFDVLQECTDELTSCESDSTCNVCATELSTSIDSTYSDSTTTEYSECLADNVDEDTSLTVCDVYGAVECCYSGDCFENEAFSNLWECVVEGVGCSTACDETSTATTTVTLGAAGFSTLMCTVVLVFTFVRMGF